MVLGLIAAGPLGAQGQAGGKTTKQAQRVFAASPGMWSGKAETLSGTISSVDSDKKVVSVQANGVGYSFKASGAKIMVGGKKAKLSDLQTGAQASVTFVASRAGDTAKKIEVQ